MSELKNKVLIDAGALQLAINVLSRNGKEEIVEELKKSCIDIPDLLINTQSKLQQVERERDSTQARLDEAERMLGFAHRARDWPHDNKEFWGRVKAFLSNQNTDKE